MDNSPIDIVHGELRPYVVFDLDGTLVRCGEYYKAAALAGARYISEKTGMPVDIARELMEHIDLAAVKALPMERAFKRSRFPASFRHALYLAEDIMTPEIPITFWEGNEIYAIGDAVFTAPYEPYLGAVGAVRAISAAGYGVALMTKGDRDVQMRKIKMHGFDQIFDFVMICERKDAETMAHFFTQIDLDPAQSWFVGDSLKDDIAPSKALGLQTVFVKEAAEHAWSYNQHDVEPTLTVSSVVEMIPLIPRVATQTVG